MNEYQISFFEVVAGSGVIGILVWGWIFIFSSAGLILGIISVITSLKVKKNQYPLALKLLFCCSIAILLTGIHGTLTGYADAFAMLGTTTGAAKAEALKLSTMLARININFAIFAAVFQSIFAGISLWIIENRAKKLSIQDLRIVKRIKQLPLLTYPLIILFIPVIYGVCCAIYSIEKIVLLKPGETLPTLLGSDFFLIVNICFTCSYIGIMLLILLLCQMIINKINRK